MNKKAKVKWGELIFSIFVILIVALSFESVKNFLIELIGIVIGIIALAVVLVLIGIAIYWYFNRDVNRV